MNPFHLSISAFLSLLHQYIPLINIFRVIRPFNSTNTRPPRHCLTCSSFSLVLGSCVIRDVTWSYVTVRFYICKCHLLLLIIVLKNLVNVTVNCRVWVGFYIFCARVSSFPVMSPDVTSHKRSMMCAAVNDCDSFISLYPSRYIFNNFMLFLHIFKRLFSFHSFNLLQFTFSRKS